MLTDRQWGFVTRPLLRMMRNESAARMLSTRAASFGVALDIDGVLLRGSKPIEGAASVIERLQSDKIPFVIMTNGGGEPEASKAASLSAKLGTKIDDDHICLCHTPMRALVEKYREKLVLLVGKRYDAIEKAMRAYGFENVITVEQLHDLFPLAYPDVPTVSNGANPMKGTDLSFAAVFVLMDPIYWGRELQITMDILSSKDGEYGDMCHEKQHVPLYTSCSDFQYVGEYPHPRFGCGAFRNVLEDLYYRSHGRKLEYQLFGKPEKVSFDFVETMINSQRHRMDGGVSGPVERIYMVGDNPLTDISGANRAGDKWLSILTNTGMYQEAVHGQNHGNPTQIVPSVKEALEWVYQREKSGNLQ